MSYPQPVFQAAITKALGLSGGAVTPYSDILVNTYGASEVWPLVDISSGTVIAAKVNSARNGTLTGWDLQNTAGPVTGTLAPYSDGVNDYSSLLTSNLVAAFDGSIGSAFIFTKVQNWTDATARFLLRFGVDASNDIIFAKMTTSNTFYFQYMSGGVFKTYSPVVGGADWFSAGMSWKDLNNGNEVKCYVNGSLLQTITPVGAWTTDPIVSARIGAANGTPANVWDGHFAYCSVKFGSVWSPTDFLAMHNAATTAGAG